MIRPYYFIFMITLAGCILAGNPAQLKLPYPLRITVNDTVFTADSAFYETLLSLQMNNRYLYHIAGVHTDDAITFTTLRLPQTLTKKDIIKQIILYYNFISDDKMRAREYLRIFPFFESLGKQSPVRCRYKTGGQFIIDMDQWATIPLPPAPSPEDKDIYNQITNRALRQNNTLDEVDPAILQAVAAQNNLSFEEAEHIYHHVLLWQRSR